MLDVICWKWKPNHGYRSTYGPAQVNVLRAMVARHYAGPHRFSCITDDPTGIDPRVRVIPLWNDHANIQSPHGVANPSCYRRLRMFAADAAELIGPRIVSLDLDVVITGDMAPVWDRPEDLVMWGGTAPPAPYNGSMILLRAGSRPQVWEKFHPITSPKAGRALHYVGSDQAWLGAILGTKEARWTRADGVYSWKMHVRPIGAKLPAGARIVIFHGQSDPWTPWAQKEAPWIRDHWRE